MTETRENFFFTYFCKPVGSNIKKLLPLWNQQLFICANLCLPYFFCRAVAFWAFMAVHFFTKLDLIRYSAMISILRDWQWWASLEVFPLLQVINQEVEHFLYNPYWEPWCSIGIDKIYLNFIKHPCDHPCLTNGHFIDWLAASSFFLHILVTQACYKISCFAGS